MAVVGIAGVAVVVAVVLADASFGIIVGAGKGVITAGVEATLMVLPLITRAA